MKLAELLLKVITVSSVNNFSLQKIFHYLSMVIIMLYSLYPEHIDFALTR